MNGIGKHKTVGLDSNVFIYHFEENEAFPFVDVIFKKLLKKEIHAVTSIISVIEVLSYPSPIEVLKGIEEGFRTIPNVIICEVNHEIAISAAAIRRTYGFRLPDAVQLATAIEKNVKVFITNDRRLKKFKELKVVLVSELLINGLN